MRVKDGRDVEAVSADSPRYYRKEESLMGGEFLRGRRVLDDKKRESPNKASSFSVKEIFNRGKRAWKPQEQGRGGRATHSQAIMKEKTSTFCK
jgi:hypothetical protein